MDSLRPRLSNDSPSPDPGDKGDLWPHSRAFRTALDNTQDFIYIFDLGGRFTYVNRSLLSLWQKPLDEAIGKNFFDLGYPVELAQRLQDQIQQVIESKAPVRDQTPFTGPTGETRFYEYIFVPVLDANERTTAVVGSTSDVTERRTAEEARNQSEERLTFALEAGGGVGAWDWDVPNDLVYCNSRFADLFSLDYLLAKSGLPIAEFTKAIHPEDRDRVAGQIGDAVRTGQEYSAEFRVLQRDGTVRWVMARGRCSDASGQPVRFPGVVFDITQQKQSEAALQDSEQQFRTLAESIPNLAWMAHPAGDIFWYNRRWYEYTGKTYEQMKGWGWQSVHEEEALPLVVERWAASLASAEPFEMIFPLRRADGVFRSFLTRVEPVKDSHGKVTHWFGTNTDITTQQMAEEELRRKNRELEEFAYVASHDLQEPLRMVNIYTQLILRHCDAADERLKQYTGFVQSGLARMETLLRDLLSYSRSVHSEELTFGTADLTQSFEEARSVLSTRIEEVGAAITVTPLPQVRGETGPLAHVFQNLLSNALKYRKTEVLLKIDITAEKHGEQWVVSVKDNGIGFNPQYAEQIFGLFKRLHKNEYEGTGLGLAICKRTIERYGGRIWGEAQLGEGAVFRFALPGVSG